MISNKRFSARRGARRMGGTAVVMLASWLGGCGSAQQPEPKQQDDAALLKEEPQPKGEAPVAPASSPKVQQGMEAIEAGDFEAAKTALEQATAENPDDPQAAYYLGLALEGSGDRAGAAEQYNKALQLDPELLEAYVNLSAVQLDQGRAEAGLQTIDRGLQTAPEHPGLLMNRALALEAMERKDDALAAYSKAVAASPDNAALRYAYAELLAAAGRKQDAVEELGRAAASDDVRVLAAAATLMGRLNAFADCVETLDEALEAEPAAQLYVRRGVCKHGLKDEEGAMADYKEAIQLDPESAPAHYYLGQHYKLIDETEQACTHLTQAIELGSGGVARNARKAVEPLDCPEPG